MSLEMAGNVTRHLSRQDACLRLALRALAFSSRSTNRFYEQSRIV